MDTLWSHNTLIYFATIFCLNVWYCWQYHLGNGGSGGKKLWLLMKAKSNGTHWHLPPPSPTNTWWIIWLPCPKRFLFSPPPQYITKNNSNPSSPPPHQYNRHTHTHTPGKNGLVPNVNFGDSPRITSRWGESGRFPKQHAYGEYEAPFYYETPVLWYHKFEFLISQIIFCDITNCILWYQK